MGVRRKRELDLPIAHADERAHPAVLALAQQEAVRDAAAAHVGLARRVELVRKACPRQRAAATARQAPSARASASSAAEAVGCSAAHAGHAPRRPGAPAAPHRRRLPQLEPQRVRRAAARHARARARSRACGGTSAARRASRPRTPPAHAAPRRARATDDVLEKFAAPALRSPSAGPRADLRRSQRCVRSATTSQFSRLPPQNERRRSGWRCA